MEEKPILHLRDIHQPAEISWWPLAPGWWLLLVATIILLIIAWRLFIPRYRKYRTQQAWIARIAKLEAMAAQPRRTHAALMFTSKMLHQLAHQKYPDKNPSELTDKAWLTFLQTTFSGEQNLAPELGRALIIGPYSPQVDLSPEARKQLFAFVHAWVVQHV